MIITILIDAMYPYSIFPKTDHQKVLESLDCLELKDWIKYTESEIAESIYVKKCLIYPQ